LAVGGQFRCPLGRTVCRAAGRRRDGGGRSPPAIAKVRMTGWLRLPLWSRVLTITT